MTFHHAKFGTSSSLLDHDDRTLFRHRYIIDISHEDASAFRELIQRGANLWPDAPPAMKEFADLITSGKVMQDYRAGTSNKSTEGDS